MLKLVILTLTQKKKKIKKTSLHQPACSVAMKTKTLVSSPRSPTVRIKTCACRTSGTTLSDLASRNGKQVVLSVSQRADRRQLSAQRLNHQLTITRGIKTRRGLCPLEANVWLKLMHLMPSLVSSFRAQRIWVSSSMPRSMKSSLLNLAFLRLRFTTLPNLALSRSVSHSRAPKLW